MYILGYDSETKLLYGVASNLKTAMKSSQDHSENFVMVTKKEWEQVQSKPTTLLPTEVGSDMAITNDAVSTIPQAEHTVTAVAGTKWGG